MDNFETKVKQFTDELKNNGDNFVFACKHKDKLCITVNGNTPKLVFLMNQLYFSLRKTFSEERGEEYADKVLKAVYSNEEQLHEYATDLLMDMLKKALFDDEKEEDDDEKTVPDSDTDDTTDEEARKKAIMGLADALHHALHGDLTNIELSDDDGED